MSKQLEILINANNIAVVRTDKLGDMILTLPLCKALKDRFPNANIFLIASEYTKALVENSDVIDKVFFIEDYEKGIDTILRENIIDVIFFPRPRFNEYLAAFKSKIPLRIGSAYRIYSFLLNCPIYEHRKESKFNEAEYNTRLLGHILNEIVETELVRPCINNNSLLKIDELLDNYLDNSKKDYIIIHPGSGGSAFEWDIQNFALLAKKLSEKKYSIMVTGNKSEKDYCKIITSQCPDCIDLSGQLNLYDLIALISKSSLLIANSTGVLHIAAALGIPVVGLYHNTPHLSQTRWGPYTEKKIIISPPDKNGKNRDNMSLIDVDTVFNAVINSINIYLNRFET